jgi:hypothetical protein
MIEPNDYPYQYLTQKALQIVANAFSMLTRGRSKAAMPWLTLN